MAQSSQDVTPTQAAASILGTETAPAHEPGKLDPSQQLQFLYKALDDNQSLIRFLDAKTAFAVALLSAMTGRVLANLGAYFPWGEQPLWRQLLVLGFGFAAVLAALLVFLIVFPTINPAANTHLLPSTGPMFFLSQLNPRKWGRILWRSPKYSRLVQDHTEYLNQITAASSVVLLQVISGEVLKVSYIRQIKTDRLKALALVLACCSILFILLMGAEAKLPKPVKPALVQVQGPVTLNPPPTSPLPPTQAAPPKRIFNPPAGRSSKR